MSAYPNSKHAKVTYFAVPTTPAYKIPSEITLHAPTGVLYLACTTPSSRVAWMPSLLHFNPSGRSINDYVATYDPLTSTITKLKMSGLDEGVNVHGMDVVVSSENPQELFVYLINHRPFLPIDKINHKKAGANSTVEIFKTTVGGSEMTHLSTVYDPDVIVTPNDVLGYPDGKSFHFTNEASVKTGLVSPPFPSLSTNLSSHTGPNYRLCSPSSLLLHRLLFLLTMQIRDSENP